jgi:hypothetical protein
VIELSVDDGMLHISGRDAIICQQGLFFRLYLNVHDASVQECIPSFPAPHFSIFFFLRALCFLFPVVCAFLSRALV